MKKNAFGTRIYEIKNIFKDEKVMKTLGFLFREWLAHLEVSYTKRQKIIDSTLKSIQNFSTKTGLIEDSLKGLYSKNGVLDKIREKLNGRAEAIYNLIEPFLGNCILDYGCGPAEIAQYVHNKKGVPVALTDIIDHCKRKEMAPLLPFDLKKPGEKLSYKDKTFDTALLITVLHHSDNPVSELEEVIRLTKGNIIIIESVYDISKNEKIMCASECAKLQTRFHSLNAKQQRMYGTFIDWFLNKMIIGNEANCPYNFNSPQGWEKIFKERELEIIEKKILGIDQPVTPEYHILYVIRRKND